ncbi:hypothetical protein BDR03DRAFT_940348 [Suillus americanus]|nr:hypothetical protein BDR03DRAFT_940348 [Suillus americanus]
MRKTADKSTDIDPVRSLYYVVLMARIICMHSSSNRTFVSSYWAFTSLYITRRTGTNEWRIKVASDPLACGRSWSFTFLKISLQQ